MEKSESIAELTKALIKAQGELEVVAKDTQAYNYKYATLPAVFEEYKKHFLKHGLVVIQGVEGNGLRTTLSHESGEWMSSVANLMPIKNDPQAQGSAITYMRRYALGAICGIMSEEDDDGKKAMPAHSQPEKSATAHSEPNKTAPVASISSETMRVIGKVEHSEDAGNGFVKYNVKGVELSTNKAPILLLMDKAEKEGAEVQVEYNEVVKGKWTNRYIAKAITVEPLPF